MTGYRAYMLNEHGKIFHGADVETADDAAAIAAAGPLLETHKAKEANTAHGVEIWRGKGNSPGI